MKHETDRGGVLVSTKKSTSIASRNLQRRVSNHLKTPAAKFQPLEEIKVAIDIKPDGSLPGKKRRKKSAVATKYRVGDNRAAIVQPTPPSLENLRGIPIKKQLTTGYSEKLGSRALANEV